MILWVNHWKSPNIYYWETYWLLRIYVTCRYGNRGIYVNNLRLFCDFISVDFPYPQNTTENKQPQKKPVTYVYEILHAFKKMHVNIHANRHTSFIHIDQSWPSLILCDSQTILTYSQLANVEREASIFSMGGIWPNIFTSFDSEAFTPIFSSCYEIFRNSIPLTVQIIDI